MKVTDPITDEGVAAGRVLARVATVLQRVHPELALQGGQLYGNLIREAYADVATDAEADALARAAFRLLPEPSEGITRGEEALRLFRAAHAAGFDWTVEDCRPVAPIGGYVWTEEDSKPVIPRFPRPRTEQPAPAPEVPEDEVA
ncbi:hypothetical protein [Kitasatospora aureofaciens]|uniref:hypothetical protein n=1 Tax=Kitasatospora aureofaciens TaxID=1894 RepID=UPI0033D7D2C9